MTCNQKKCSIKLCNKNSNQPIKFSQPVIKVENDYDGISIKSIGSPVDEVGDYTVKEIVVEKKDKDGNTITEIAFVPTYSYAIYIDLRLMKAENTIEELLSLLKKAVFTSELTDKEKALLDKRGD